MNVILRNQELHPHHIAAIVKTELQSMKNSEKMVDELF